MADDPFPASDFDEWADTYDDSVSTEEFLFSGYKDVLAKTAELSQPRPGLTVLDLGTGTGNLARLFDRLGCDLWCTDFSEAMLAKARRKLPQAHFAQQDLRAGWPDAFPPRFDRIVSAYVFHHFEWEEKVRLVNGLIQEHLLPRGRLVIADIAFANLKTMDELKKKLGSEWEEEYYWVADESVSALKQRGLKVQYTQVSSCAGIFTIQS